MFNVTIQNLWKYAEMNNKESYIVNVRPKNIDDKFILPIKTNVAEWSVKIEQERDAFVACTYSLGYYYKGDAEKKRDILKIALHDMNPHEAFAYLDTIANDPEESWYFRLCVNSLDTILKHQMKIQKVTQYLGGQRR